MKKKPKIKIFVAHHKPWYIYEDDVYVPIQVWKKNAKVDLWILWDDTGDNISEKNDNYAELTAQYWVWKNYDLRDVDYVWFCHYRRYMTYCYKPTFWNYLFVKNPFGILDTPFPYLWKIKSWKEWNVFLKYKENILLKNKKELLKYISENENDIYTVKREVLIEWKLRKFFWMQVNGFFDFCFDWIWKSDRDRKYKAKEIFLKMYPDYEWIIKDVMEECKEYFPLHRHVFIMRKDLFYEYMNRLFKYLFALEEYINKNHLQTSWIYGDGESRFMWIFSEPLINYRKLRAERERWVKVSSKSNLLFFID